MTTALRTKEHQGTLRCYFEVGRFVAGQVERELRKAAFAYGLDLDIERRMGWLDGVLFLTAIGRADKVTAFRKALEEWKP